MGIKGRVTVVILTLLMVASLAGCGYGPHSVSHSWSARGVNSDVERDYWIINATSINGHTTRRLELSAAEIGALHVQSSNRAGGITVTLTQGDTVEVFDVSTSFDGLLDTGAFEGGRIRIRVDFDRAEGIEFHASWIVARSAR